MERKKKKKPRTVLKHNNDNIWTLCYFNCIHWRHLGDTLIQRSQHRRAQRDFPIKTTPARFTTFAGSLHWEVSFSGTEISLILKSIMAAVGISLKIIYLFLLLVLIGRRLNLFIGDMYNRCTCPVQPCRHLTLELLIQGHLWSAKVPHVTDFRSAYISLIIGPRGLQCETNLQEIMGWESFDVVRFDLGSLLQGQTRIAKLKSANNSLIIGPRGVQCETNLQEIMGWESSDVVRFDLGPLLQGQMSIVTLKSAYNSFIIGFIGLQCETNLSEIMGSESFDVLTFDLEPLLQG